MRGQKNNGYAVNRRDGFTLIEVLIVVVIMAVLAATIIPQFSSSANDAKESSVKFNLHTLRSQIELYKLHHGGLLPSDTAIVNQLTLKTDVAGATGTGVTHIYGPYVQSIPTNPFNNLATINGGAAALPGAANTHGYRYNAATGDIKLDSTNATYAAW